MRVCLLRSLFLAASISLVGCSGDDAGDDDAGNGDGDGGSATAYVVVVTSVSPDHGPLPGGTVITITGEGFFYHNAPPNQVLVGGVETEVVEVVDDTTLITRTPPGEEAGPVDVIVYNSNGFGTAEEAFSYNPRPTITAVDADHGDRAGGETVTITGTGFQDLEAGTNVLHFGENQASDVSVASDTSLTVTSPPGEPFSIVDVALKNENGFAVLPQSYEYTVETVSLIAHGRRAGAACGCECIRASKVGLWPAYPSTQAYGLPLDEPMDLAETSQLYQIDPETGIVSSIGECIDGLTGLAQAPDGTMYGVTTNKFADAPYRSLFTVDLATAEVTLVGSLSTSYNVNDIAYVDSGMGEGLAGVSWQAGSGSQFGQIDTENGTYAPMGGTELNVGNVGGNGLAWDGDTLYVAKKSTLCEVSVIVTPGELSNCIPLPPMMSALTAVDGELYGAASLYQRTSSTIQHIDKETGDMTHIATIPAWVTSLAAAE